MLVIVYLLYVRWVVRYSNPQRALHKRIYGSARLSTIALFGYSLSGSGWVSLAFGYFYNCREPVTRLPSC